MLDKMLGVSPPQKGKTSNSEVDVKLADREQYRNDFEKALQKKLEDKREAKIAEKAKLRQESKSKKAKNDDKELGAEKEEKSSGGTKKKMTRNDEMISNIMASIESEVEIPDSKIEELAMIEVGSKTEAVQNQILTAQASVDELVNAQAAQEQYSAAQVVAEQSSLADAVGFESEFSGAMATAPSGFADKLKQLNLEKPENSESSSALKFEQSVLDQLKKDVQASAQANTGGQSESGSEQKNSDNLSKDLKSDLLQGGLSTAGMTPHEFKAHISQNLAAQAAPNVGATDQSEANVKEIMNQAQYLVKQGGGEVTVKMTPEGMGEVQLRVLLQNGKLNVEMQTADKEVKKMIEESLSELKSGLAAHRLSLEHVKIDTVSATNADNNTQFQSNLNQGNDQHQGQNFLRDFQNQNQKNSAQQSFSHEMSQRGLAKPEISVTRSNVQAARTYGGTKGATLNRVA